MKISQLITIVLLDYTGRLSILVLLYSQSVSFVALGRAWRMSNTSHNPAVGENSKGAITSSANTVLFTLSLRNYYFPTLSPPIRFSPGMAFSLHLSSSLYCLGDLNLSLQCGHSMSVCRWWWSRCSAKASGDSHSRVHRGQFGRLPRPAPT